MKQGTFNKIFRVGNLIVKISKEHSSISREIAKMGSGDVKGYEEDIRTVGINTSKVYMYSMLGDRTFILQRYIDGCTLQEFFENKDVSNLEKLKAFKELILLYKKSLKNDNLCLDWNLKNFIVSKGSIYYIDYVPALYKDRIMSTNSERLTQYKESYLDRQVQLAGIVSYAIVPFFSEEKESMNLAFKTMVNCIRCVLGVDFDSVNNKDNVYIQKMMMISHYLNSNQQYNEFISQYNSISMEKTAIKPKKYILNINGGGKN